MNTETREILERPFETNLIKTRRGQGGKALSYVEGAEYIKRLNEAFDAQWSFKVVDYKILDKEVVVHGRLTAAGFTKEAFGGHQRQANGDLGDELKSAATDALKKASSLFGLGLHLYSSPTGGHTGGQAAPAPTDTGAPDPRKASDKQIALIRNLARRLKKDEDWLDRKCLEAHGVRFDKLTKAQASKVIDCLNAAIDKRSN